MNLTTEQREKVEDLKDAANAAREVFETSHPTPEMVFGCVDADAEAISALKESARIAREVFGSLPMECSAEMVFGIYDHVFTEDDEDDEDDEDEDVDDTDED